MNNREKFEQELDGIKMPDEVFNKTLDAMEKQKKRRVSFGRFAAVMGAVAVIAVGGSFMFRYMFGDLQPANPGATPPHSEGSPQPTHMHHENDNRPKVGFIPKIKSITISGGDDEELYRQSMNGQNTQVINNAEELRAFEESVGGIKGADSFDVDFSSQAVIIVFGFDSSSPVYLPPVVRISDNTMHISRRTEPYEIVTDDITLRGYMLIVDRPFGFTDVTYDGTTQHLGSDPLISDAISLRNDVTVYYDAGGQTTYVFTEGGVVIALPYNNQHGYEMHGSCMVFSHQPYLSVSVPATFAAIFCTENMTGVTFTTEDTGLLIEWEEGERFSVRLADQDYQYHTVATARMKPDSAWSVEWVKDDNPPPSPSAEPGQLDLSFLIDIDWPEPINYTPNPKVFPLTGTTAMYKTSMSGKITFADENLNPIALPFEPQGYAVIGGGAAYALHNGTDWVLMHNDGTTAHGITLRDIGENGALFESVGSAVVISRRNSRRDGWLHGLYDVEQQREILPMEYQELNIAPNFSESNPGRKLPIFYGVKNGMGYLLDNKGKVLYEMGAADDSAWDWNRLYILNQTERKFYKAPGIMYGNADIIDVWSGFYIVRGDGADETRRGLFIFDTEGREVYRTEVHRSVCFDASFNDGLMIDTGDGFVFMDENGNFRTQDFGRLSVGADWHIDGPIYRCHYTRSHIIYDADRNVLLRTDLEPLVKAGDFAVCFRYIDDEMRFLSEAYAVYDLKGNLLMDDVFGVIWEIPGPGGGLFVYLDENTCVLLTPDGRTVPVHSAPVVEKVYSGG
jgi:hypothetical protein